MAVLATIPGREEALAQCLHSLRPQVDELVVVCNGFDIPPRVALDVATEVILHPVDQLGSAAKLLRTRDHRGLYLGCDDDLAYPPDYVETMRHWVRTWHNRAIISTHGRVLRPEARAFLDADEVHRTLDETPGAWVNYPGGCGLAFDTAKVPVPSRVPGKNNEESELAVWAQLNQVPIWVVQHPAGWVKYLLDKKVSTIFKDEKASNYEGRNRVLRQIRPWKVYQVPTPANMW